MTNEYLFSIDNEGNFRFKNSNYINKDKLIANLEAKIALLPEDYEEMSLSQRGAYDAYLNILNEIKK